MARLITDKLSLLAVRLTIEVKYCAIHLVCRQVIICHEIKEIRIEEAHGRCVQNLHHHEMREELQISDVTEQAIHAKLANLLKHNT